MLHYPDCLIVDDTAYYWKLTNSLAVVDDHDGTKLISFLATLIWLMSFKYDEYDQSLLKVVENTSMTFCLRDCDVSDVRSNLLLYGKLLREDIEELNPFTYRDGKRMLPYCYRGRVDGKLILEKLHEG